MLNEMVILDSSKPKTPLFGSTRHDRHEQRGVSTSLVPRGRALFWEGEEEAHKIEIVEGVVRAVRLLENGNRQILAFYWPGDVVMPTQSTCQQFTAEAVTDCRVLRSKVSGVCRGDEPCGSHQVLADTLSLVLTMSQKNCVARIAWLLLRIRAHLPADPKRPDARRNSSIFPTVKRLGSSICRGCKRFPVGGLRLMKSGSFQPNGGIGDRECPELMARTNDRASADGRRLAES